MQIPKGFAAVFNIFLNAAASSGEADFGFWVPPATR